MPIKATVRFVDERTFPIEELGLPAVQARITAETETAFLFVETTDKGTDKHRIDTKASFSACDLDKTIIVCRNYGDAALGFEKMREKLCQPQDSLAREYFSNYLCFSAPH